MKLNETVGEMMLRKAREPSTWKGVGWMLAAAGLVPFASVDLVVSAGVALVGLVEIVKRDR